MINSPINSPLSEADRMTTGSVLQSALVDLVDLSLIGKQAHWNVVGKEFRSVHLQLDELVSLARTYADEVAERAAAIGVSPNGKARTVADNSEITGFPDGWTSDADTISAVVAVLGDMIKRMRLRIDETDKADLVTQDLLIEITRELEKQYWRWQAQRA